MKNFLCGRASVCQSFCIYVRASICVLNVWKQGMSRARNTGSERDVKNQSSQEKRRQARGLQEKVDNIKYQDSELSCQEQEMSRENRIKRMGRHQNRMSRERGLEEKETSKQRGGHEKGPSRDCRTLSDVKRKNFPKRYRVSNDFCGYGAKVVCKNPQVVALNSEYDLVKMHKKHSKKPWKVTFF